MHIRRGDYAALGLALKESLVRGVIETVVERIPEMTLFVFSDDILWCREHAEEVGLNLPYETVFVEGNTGEKSFRDLQLMSLCQSMMVGPSAFNYLAALLNKNLKQNGYVGATDREI